MKTIKNIILLNILLITNLVNAQNYYFEDYQPFDESIPTPEEFLGYKIGDFHTRHDLIVSYIEKLAELSDRATLEVYGYTNERRKLLMLTITSPKNHRNIDNIKSKHLQIVNGENVDYTNLPVFINLGYNVHGNELSGAEASLLTAYTLVSSKNPKVLDYLNKSIVFLDPVINPDGRDRAANWVNRYKGYPLIKDKFDIEHNEAWPMGRTNHYQFDLNRDLLLAVQPESIARLEWFYSWRPNVITDFHEMGSKKTFFFEPKPVSASLNPVTPNENYELTTKFAKGYIDTFNKLGSLYFTKEIYDATYPGYGSTYADLQGSLAILFEQASVRGHLIETQNGDLSFPFAIRNQYAASMATVNSSVINKDLLYSYQNKFYEKVSHKSKKSNIKGYVFGDNYDKNRNKYFIDLLLKHQIKVYTLKEDIIKDGKTYKKDFSYVVPTNQQQNLMVKTMFETNIKYRDSVFYDASSWSLANFYNMKYSKLSHINVSQPITQKTNTTKISNFEKSNYAYLISWDDYNSPALLYELLDKEIGVKIAKKSITTISNNQKVTFDRGSMLIPIMIQNKNSDEVYKILSKACSKYKIQAYSINNGYSIEGLDLGSINISRISKPKVMMLFGAGVSAYESVRFGNYLNNVCTCQLLKSLFLFLVD